MPMGCMLHVCLPLFQSFSYNMYMFHHSYAFPPSQLPLPEGPTPQTPLPEPWTPSPVMLYVILYVHTCVSCNGMWCVEMGVYRYVLISSVNLQQKSIHNRVHVGAGADQEITA